MCVETKKGLVRTAYHTFIKKLALIACLSKFGFGYKKKWGLLNARISEGLFFGYG